jgi:hypothetical protein
VWGPSARKFSASHTGKQSVEGRRNRAGLAAAGISPEAGDCLHPTMFIDGDTTLTMDDTITNVLKSKLSAAEIAKATALAITRR